MGHGYGTIKVKIELDTQLCKNWETLEEKRMNVLSIAADGKGVGGQALNHIRQEAEKYIMPEHKRKLYNRIYDIWHKYHCNDMQAGTKVQTEALLKKDPKLHSASNYADACKYLKNIGLFEDRGYKYGADDWLCKEIPADIVAEIMTWKYIQNESQEEIKNIKQQCLRQTRQNN